MSKYQYSKLVMEKYLRRSFYDAVLELYEAAQGARIISVSLEGTLSLVVNKDDSFLIKLNEVAQRADDREEHLRYKGLENMKLEGAEQYIVKKEEAYHRTPVQHPLPLDDAINLELNQKDWSKCMIENNDGQNKMTPVIDDTKTVKLDEPALEQISDHKGDNDTGYEKSSDGETDSEDDTESEFVHSHHPPVAVPDFVPSGQSKPEVEPVNGDDFCFVPVSECKRKADVKDSDPVELPGKKSPHKRRKTMSSTDGDDDASRAEEVEKMAATISSTAADDGANSGLQLLPHTATGPIIVEDEDNNYSGGQMAQLAMLQMREPIFRPQDFEELARHQQWQMVAYQRSFMEKSYLQHHMQQYQRDTAERLRWEYAAAQQAREYPQSGEEAEKLYRQATQAQSSGAEAALLAAVALEEASKGSREMTNEMVSANSDKMAASQYLRILSDDPSANAADMDYEEGELRPESHNCVLCNTKFSSMDLLLRHMENHRTAFERSCSVCQSGTLTGSMLILHMEASHGPESSFTLPSSAPPVTMSATVSTSLTSSVIEYPQSFSTALPNYNGVALEAATPVKLPQQQQDSPKGSTGKDELKEDSLKEGMQNLNYHLATVGSHSTAVDPPSTVAAAATATTSGSSQDGFMGIPPQFYPLIGCQVCGEKFAMSEALDQHVENQHKELQCTYSCKPCALTFNKHVELSKHRSRHETVSTNLKCSHCLKSFKSVKQLRLHYVAAHACCHFCEYCRAGFPDAVALQIHEQLHTLDPEKLSYRCDICNKAFYTQSQCSAHKRTHKDEKAHACEICGSAFFKRGDLTKHVRTVHSPSRLFACKFCGKKGTRMDNMRSHVRSHHKNMTRDQIINMIEVIE